MEVAPGVLARVPATSREGFLEAVDGVVAGASWRADRAASFRSVMAALAEVADGRNGRDVAVSVARLVEVAGCSRRTVFRRLAEARAVGLLVDVVRGRHTTRAERVASAEARGRELRRFATVRALSVPADLAPHHTGLKARSGPQSVDGTQRARRAAKRSTSTSGERRAPRSLEAQRLAGRLVAAAPGLDHGRHLGGLAGGLERVLGERLAAWSPSDVLAAAERQGWVWAAAEARSPFAWVLGRLRLALVAGATSAAERGAAARADVEARAARRAAERAAEAADRATAGSAEAVEARSSIRDAIAAARAARSYGRAA